jgi:hypothetical protein
MRQSTQAKRMCQVRSAVCVVALFYDSGEASHQAQLALATSPSVSRANTVPSTCFTHSLARFACNS